MVYTGRVSRTLDALGTRIAGSVITQRENDSTFSVGGFEVEQSLMSGGRIRLELPVSAGAVPATAGRPGSAALASAWDHPSLAVRIELDQPLVRDTNLRVRLGRTPSDFLNPYGQITVAGQRTAGAWLETPIVGQTVFRAGVENETNRSRHLANERNTVGAGVATDLGYLRLQSRVDSRRYRDYRTARGVNSRLLTAAFEWQPIERFTASVRREQNLGSEADPTYPNQSLFGVRYLTGNGSELFATQRLASAPIVPISDAAASGFFAPQGTRETAIGIQSPMFPHTTLTSRYRLDQGMSGTDAFAVIGAVARLPFRRDLSVDWGLDRGQLVAGKADSYTAGSVTLAYTPADRYRATLRYELRKRSSTDHGVLAGVAGRIAPGLTALARYRVMESADGMSLPLKEGELAFAVRPLQSDRAAMLFSYAASEHPILAGSASSSHVRIDRLSADGLLQLPAQFQLYGRLSSTRQSGRTSYLLQNRLQRPLFGRFDAAAEARWMRASTRDPGRLILAAEWGTWIAPELRAGIGYSSGAFSVPGSVLNATASRGGAYLILSTRLAALFDLMPQ